MHHIRWNTGHTGAKFRPQREYVIIQSVTQSQWMIMHRLRPRSIGRPQLKWKYKLPRYALLTFFNIKCERHRAFIFVKPNYR